MIVINLAGIQAMDIPVSLFDEFFEKRSQFANAKYPEGTDVVVDVVWEEANRFQEHGKALLCKIDNCPIGYIPVLKTIEGYVNDTARAMADALASMNAGEHNRLTKKWFHHQERYAAASSARDYVETELFRNDGTCRGVLNRVQIEDGVLFSVSVAFDAM